MTVQKIFKKISAAVVATFIMIAVITSFVSESASAESTLNLVTQGSDETLVQEITDQETTSEAKESANSLYINQDTSYQVFIEDKADLLTDEEEKNLAARMNQLTDHGGVAFVSTTDTGGLATKEYARQKCYEFFGGDSGSVFLIDMQNRIIYIFSNGKIYETVTNEKATIITDNIYKHAKKGDYYKCAVSAFEQELTLLGGGRIARPMKYISNALIAIVAGLLINYFIVRAARRSNAKSNAALLGAVRSRFEINNINPELIKTTKTPIISGGGFSGGSGGGFSGGGGGFSGGGGGGFSGGGGGGGHSF